MTDVKMTVGAVSDEAKTTVFEPMTEAARATRAPEGVSFAGVNLPRAAVTPADGFRRSNSVRIEMRREDFPMTLRESFESGMERPLLLPGLGGTMATCVEWSMSTIDDREPVRMTFLKVSDEAPEKSTPSSGWVKVHTGEGEHRIGAGAVLRHKMTNLRFRTVNYGDYHDGDLCPVVSIDEGAATNVGPGAELEWIDPAPGVARDVVVAELDEGLTGGTGPLVPHKPPIEDVSFLGRQLRAKDWTVVGKPMPPWGAASKPEPHEAFTVVMPLGSLTGWLLQKLEEGTSGPLIVPGLGTIAAICVRWTITKETATLEFVPSSGQRRWRIFAFQSGASASERAAMMRAYDCLVANGCTIEGGEAMNETMLTTALHRLMNKIGAIIQALPRGPLIERPEPPTP